LAAVTILLFEVAVRLKMTFNPQVWPISLTGSNAPKSWSSLWPVYSGSSLPKPTAPKAIRHSSHLLVSQISVQRNRAAGDCDGI